MTVIESAVRSQQDHLMVLQKPLEGLKSLEQLGETGGLDFKVLENQGVPERILLKLPKLCSDSFINTLRCGD